MTRYNPSVALVNRFASQTYSSRGTFPEIRQRGLLLLFCLALITQGFLFFRNPVASGSGLPAILAAEVALGGPLLYFASRREDLKWSGLYVAQIGAIFGAAYFCITDWTSWGEDIRTSDLVLSDSLAVVAAGLGACMLAVVLPERLRERTRTRISLDPIWGKWPFWLASYVATIWVDAFAQSEHMGFILVILQRWPLHAIIALDLMCRTGRAPREISRLVWWVLVPIRMLMNFGTGFGMFVIHDAVVVLYYLSMKRVIRLRLYGIACFAAFAVVVFAGRTYVRQVIWQQASGPEETTRLDVAVRTINGLWHYSVDDFVQSANSLAGDRIGHYGLLAHTVVVRDTPESIPYLYGQSFYQFVWTFVPRAIYPNKPTENWGQQFGHRYGLLAPNDTYTSFNMPQITEAYANGGIWLTLVLMFGITWIVRRVAFWTECIEKDSDDVLWLILPVVFGYLSDCESNFSLSVNAAIYSALVLGFPAFVKRRRHVSLARINQCDSPTASYRA